jgi:hypothetical protein
MIAHESRMPGEAVGVSIAVTRLFVPHKAKQRADLLHLTAHRSLKWTLPCLWLHPKERNSVYGCLPSVPTRTVIGLIILIIFSRYCSFPR